MVIGAPGSGKTTLCKKHYSGYICFDNDRVIEAVWGSLQYHASIKHLAKGMVREGIRRAMEGGLAIALPASGRTRKDRSRYIDIAKEFDYQVEIVKSSATPEECLSRCKADKSRPASTDWGPIIEHWFKVFEPVENGECNKYSELSLED